MCERETDNYMSLIDWLIDVNGISTCQGLFCAYRFGNGVRGTFIFIFFVQYLKIFSFLLMVIKYQVFLSNTNILQTDLFDP